MALFIGGVLDGLRMETGAVDVVTVYQGYPAGPIMSEHLARRDFYWSTATEFRYYRLFDGAGVFTTDAIRTEFYRAKALAGHEAALTSMLITNYPDASTFNEAVQRSVRAGYLKPPNKE